MKSNEPLEPRMPQFRVLVGHHNLPSQHMIPSGISLERGSGFSYLNTPPYLLRCHKCSWAAVITRIPITDLKVRSSKKKLLISSCRSLQPMLMFLEEKCRVKCFGRQIQHQPV
jgi:hypothetical protein